MTCPFESNVMTFCDQTMLLDIYYSKNMIYKIKIPPFNFSISLTYKIPCLIAEIVVCFSPVTSNNISNNGFQDYG